jgi:hypothetical protein
VDEAAPASVSQLVSQLAAAEGLDRREEDGRVEYGPTGRPFVVVGSGEVRFRLRKDVVRAALTTPGTHADAAGPEWIALDASRADRFSLDRARAWFEFALRQAAPQ